MDTRPLLNESDLDWALAEVSTYFDNEPPLGSPEAARFEVLTALIENYEGKHWAIDPLASVRPGRMARRYKARAEWLKPRQKMTRHRIA